MLVNGACDWLLALVKNSRRGGADGPVGLVFVDGRSAFEVLVLATPASLAVTYRKILQMPPNCAGIVVSCPGGVSKLYKKGAKPGLKAFFINLIKWIFMCP
jgi:hypothetical protein